MDNTEKQATLGSQDTGRRQTKQENITQKTKKMSVILPTIVRIVTGLPLFTRGESL